MKYINDAKVRYFGSHLQGQIVVDFATLVNVFGEPSCNGDEYKIQKQWCLQFEDGVIATIYDWKEGDTYNGPGEGTHYTKVIDWHIGGFDIHAVWAVQDAITQWERTRVSARTLENYDANFNKVKAMAKIADMYVDEKGATYNIIERGDNEFTVTNGEELIISYREVDLTVIDFYKMELVKVEEPA